MDWIWKTPLHYAMAQCHLKLGNPSAARDFAEQLLQAAGFPRNQTYEALGHQLLCDVALNENDSKTAQAEITTALNIVRTTDLPLAEWRVLQSAAAAFEKRARKRSKTLADESRVAFSKLVDGLDATLPGIRSNMQASLPGE